MNHVKPDETLEKQTIPRRHPQRSEPQYWLACRRSQQHSAPERYVMPRTWDDWDGPSRGGNTKAEAACFCWRKQRVNGIV